MSAKKKIIISIAVGLFVSFIFNTAGFAEKCEEVSGKVLRLHIVAASDSEEGLLQLLQEDGNAKLTEKDGQSVLTAYYDADMQPVTEEAAAADESALRLEATWVPKESATGSFVKSDIAVYAGSGQDPVYTLDTGVYVREEGER